MARRKFFLTPDERKLLQKARRLVTGTHWIKGKYSCSIDDKDCWCLVGLLNHVQGVDPNSGAAVALDRDSLLRQKEMIAAGPAYFTTTDLPRRRIFYTIAKAIRTASPRTAASSIESWNDRRQTTREDVLKVIDLALKMEVE